jgi:hypothetical protein
MTETAAHPHGGRMTAIVPLNDGLPIHLMKRGVNLTHIARSHALTHVTAMMIGTSDTTTQVGIVPIGLSRDLQGFLPRMNLWTVHVQATESPMTLTLAALIPATVMPHLLEMTALAVFYEGMIILLMILLTKVLGIMMIRYVVILEQRSVPGIPNPSMGAPTLRSYGILIPRIKVQVDHRL